MKVNMNIIVGGTDDILDDILSAARTVRKEMKNIFESVETETLQKMDICVCLSGNISKYYPKSGIYQARYYSKAKKFMVYVHFSSNEWNSKKTESVSKFLKMYKDYLMELSDIIKTKTTKYKPDFDSRCYEDGIKSVFENLKMMLGLNLVMEDMIGKIVKVKVDRKLGSAHPDYPEHIYPINYGYIEGIIAPDGEEQDVYILGVDKAVDEYEGELIAVIKRDDDEEEKWVIAPIGIKFTVEEIEEAVRFQEKYFKSHIEML